VLVVRISRIYDPAQRIAGLERTFSFGMMRSAAADFLAEQVWKYTIIKLVS
jgi:hypothetical protein